MKKIFTLLFILASFFAESQTIVISQLYGAGGNTGATLNADYVELHNVSSVPQSLTGFSIQYASATSTGTWTGVSPLPSVTIPAGGYYLIQMSSTGANGSALPTPDYVSAPTIAMGGANGKVALVNNTTPLTSTAGGCPQPTAAVIDFVGYGTANCAEGTPTAALTVTDAGKRKNNGCQDTNNNSSDFDVLPAAPRNSATAAFVCSGTPVPSLTAGTVVNFGNVTVGTNSTSQSFSITGSNLTGAPGVITITAPNTDFQVSNDNTAWGASTTIPYTSATLASTLVYVRFTPQSAGPKSGNVTVAGGGASTVNVAVSGNGVAPVGPAVTATAINPFGNVCINTVVGPNSFVLSGTNLTTADITVGPANGYSFSTSAGGTYTLSITITPAAGAVTQPIFVQFKPLVIGAYNGPIPVTGGGLAAQYDIPVSGAGVDAVPSLTTGTASGITTTGATLGGDITSVGCSAVTAYGIEFSTTNGFANGTGTQVPSGNLSGTGYSSTLSTLAPATTYYYKAYATNAAGTGWGSQMTFITAAPPPPALSVTALTAFGNVCINSVAGPNPVDLSGVNLTTADIVVGPLEGYTFSTSATGTFTPTLTLTQTGGTFAQTIYVQFTPTQEIAYDGNIPVTGAGATAINISATGSGFISTPVVATSDSTLIDANTVYARGSIIDPGCTTVTAYGIEYSGINGFTGGTGIKVPSDQLNGADFTSQLFGLVQNTAYYYRAYATNTGGTAYGEVKRFFSPGVPAGLTLYSIPVVRGTNLHYTLSGVKPGHYAARIFNSVGQLVFQKDMILQVNFIDDNIIFPAYLPIGMYTFEVYNQEFNIHKTFLVQ